MTEGSENTMESVARDIKAVVGDKTVNTFLSLFYTADVVNKFLNDEVRKHGWSRTKLDVLNTLIRHGGTMTPTKLSDRVFRSKNTITKVIDSLEKEELVRREGPGKDRRTTKVAITAKGLRVVKETLPSTKHLSYTALSILEQDSIDELNSNLRQIRRHLLRLMDISSSRGK